MTTANEDWIQNSLARLEALEQQRAQLENGRSAEQLAGLDEEIRTLYEALEAVANDEDGDGSAEEDEAPALALSTPAAPPASAGSPDADASSDAPFGAPTVGFGAPAAGLAAMPAVPADVDFDVEPTRSKAPLVMALLAGVALLGAGGWYFTQQSAPEPPPADPGPAKVITASEIPDDTQEPDVARGANADRTEGTRFRESAQSQRRSGSGNARPRPRQSGSNNKESEKIEIGSTRDPLAGVK